jgi:hypothetical protein
MEAQVPAAQPSGDEAMIEVSKAWNVRYIEEWVVDTVAGHEEAGMLIDLDVIVDGSHRLQVRNRGIIRTFCTFFLENLNLLMGPKKRA